MLYKVTFVFIISLDFVPLWFSSAKYGNAQSNCTMVQLILARFLLGRLSNEREEQKLCEYDHYKHPSLFNQYHFSLALCLFGKFQIAILCF